VRVLGVGSLFASIDLLRDGFKAAFQQSAVIRKVKFFQPTIAPALGSAILAAKQVGIQIEIERSSIEICTITA
jgi:hypothetical protein